MSTIQIVSILLIVFGILVSFFALFVKSRDKDKKPQTAEKNLDFFELERGLNEMSEAVDEMDKTLEEFHKTANSAFTELEEKHQELLFLYSLMDEKKKEIANIYSAPPLPTPKSVSMKEPTAAVAVSKSTHQAADNSEKNKSSHPKRKEILNLSRQGLSVSEIAEELNVGQDMVKLILQLGKAR